MHEIGEEKWRIKGDSHGMEIKRVDLNLVNSKRETKAYAGSTPLISYTKELIRRLYFVTHTHVSIFMQPPF